MRFVVIIVTIVLSMKKETNIALMVLYLEGDLIYLQ